MSNYADDKDTIIVKNFIHKEQYKRTISFYVWLQSFEFIFITIMAIYFLYAYPDKKVVIFTIIFIIYFYFYLKNSVKYYREDTNDMFVYRKSKEIVLWLREKKFLKREKKNEKNEN